MSQENILITGGTSAVGRAIIPRLVQEGYAVFFTSRHAESTIEGATCLQADLLEADGSAKLLKLLQDKNITVHHLINNFRDIDNLKTDENAQPSEAQWLREYQSAVTVPAALSYALARQSALRSIINIVSIYGITAANLNLYQGDARAAPIHYNVAKAAQIHLTKELAIRLASQKIRVNAVAYGGIKGRAPAEFEARYAALCPFEGMLESDDLEGIITFLLSESQAGKMTGQTLQIDGGWTLW